MVEMRWSTLEMAESRVGRGALLLLPKRRFMVGGFFLEGTGGGGVWFVGSGDEYWWKGARGLFQSGEEGVDTLVGWRVGSRWKPRFGRKGLRLVEE